MSVFRLETVELVDSRISLEVLVQTSATIIVSLQFSFSGT